MKLCWGTDAAKKTQSRRLSNGTVRRRTEELLADIQSQLLERLRSCGQFSIQLGESTDISSAIDCFGALSLGRRDFGELYVLQGGFGQDNR